MKLVSVFVKGFRCFLDESALRIGSLTAIIGKNDVGKSSLLDALEIFFNNETVKLDAADCHVAATERDVEIACEFTDLPTSLVLDAQAETTLQDEHLLTQNGNLRIKKIFRCGGAKTKEEVFVCAHHPTAAQYDDLLELTNAALKKRLRDLGIDETDVQLNSNPSMRRAIWAACPHLTLADVEIPAAKEDGKRIWDKLREHLPLYALFQSDRRSRDSDAEVQNPMKLAVAAALAETAVQEKLTDVVGAVRAKVLDLAERTHSALVKIDQNLAAQLTPEFKADPKWASLFDVELASDQGIPVNKRGSGVRRLILVSFFRAEAERRLAQGGLQNIIYAIEEPETSQHPHNQRMLLESLQDLSAEPGCQVLLTTHSPGLASYLPTENLRFIRTGEDGRPAIEDATEATWQRVAETLGVVPDNRVRLLLCVEGPSDVTALKHLSAALHAVDATIPNLASESRVAFVVLGGGTLTHWVNERYLRGLDRPEVHIYDSDVQKYATAVQQVNDRTDGSWATQTTKAEIENYLHPDAIQEAIGITVACADDNDVPALVAAQKGWKTETAKRKLAQYAFPRMTAARIRARDQTDEVEGWLRRIAAML